VLNFLEENNSKSVWRHYNLAPWSRLLLEKLTSSQIVKQLCILQNQKIYYHVHKSSPVVFLQPDKSTPSYTISLRHIFISFFELNTICSVGQRFALLEEKAVLSTVLRKFKLESVSRKEEMDLLFQLILRPKQGLKIKITPR